MGHWCVDDNKGKHISVAVKGASPLTEVEKDLYSFIEKLEAQIERLEKDSSRFKEDQKELRKGIDQLESRLKEK